MHLKIPVWFENFIIVIIISVLVFLYQKGGIFYEFWLRNEKNGLNFVVRPRNRENFMPQNFYAIKYSIPLQRDIKIFIFISCCPYEPLTESTYFWKFEIVSIWNFHLKLLEVL